jgi:hypothetical protein
MAEDAEHVDPEQGFGGSESVHMSYLGEEPWTQEPSNHGEKPVSLGTSPYVEI